MYVLIGALGFQRIFTRVTRAPTYEWLVVEKVLVEVCPVLVVELGQILDQALVWLLKYRVYHIPCPIGSYRLWQQELWVTLFASELRLLM